MNKVILPKQKAITVFLVFALGYYISNLLRAITATISPNLISEFNLAAGDLGLLGGGYFLGFAGVLNEIEVSTNLFISSLISFNVGVELGQISVIILSYFLIALSFQKKSWYRDRVTKPISMIIASIGFYWFIDRLFF